MVTIEHAARHEAAHALTAWYYGMFLRQVQIKIDPLAGIGSTQGFCDAQPDTVLSIEGVYNIMAGPVSDDLHDDGHCIFATDFQYMVDNFRFPADLLKMHSFWAKHPRRTLKDMQKFYQTFKAPVVKLLRSRKGKRAWTALTKELMQKQRLSGIEAVAVLEKAWGQPLPKHAIPSVKHGNNVKDPLRGLDDLIDRLRRFYNVLDEDVESLRGTLSDPENARIDEIKKALIVLKLNLLDD